MTYDRLKTLVLTAVVAAPVLLFYAGCTVPSNNNQPTKPQEKKVIQTLEDRTKTPKEISADDLINIYQKAFPKAEAIYKEINTAIADYSRRSNISIYNVPEEDIKKIQRPYKERLANDPEMKALSSLNINQLNQLSKVLFDRLDMSRARRHTGELWTTISTSLQYFYDPELVLPVNDPKVNTSYDIRIDGGIVYKNKNGKEVIEVGSGYWTPFDQFGPRPGSWARRTFEESLGVNENALSSLKEILDQTKRDTSSADLEKLINEDRNKALKQFLEQHNYLGGKSPPITYFGMTEAQKQINGLIARDKTLLRK